MCDGLYADDLRICSKHQVYISSQGASECVLEPEGRDRNVEWKG